MNVQTVQKEYRKYLKHNYDPARAVKEKAYLYSDNEHHGLSAVQMVIYYKKLNAELKLLTKSDAMKLVQYFWNLPSHEEKMLSLHVLNLFADKLNLSDMPLIEKMMRESKGWVYLDNLIIPVMPFLLNKYNGAYKILEKWNSDKDFWVRRSAMLAQLLNFRAGNRGDKKLFFKFAEFQLDERWINDVYKDTSQRSRARFFIRKAIGWVLRDMSVKDPASVYKFLVKNKGRMSTLSFREGSRKLPVGFSLV